MKSSLKYFCAAAFLLLCGRSSAQKIVSVYNDESEINAQLGSTLSDGFYVPAGSALRIFTDGPSYLNCLPLSSAPSADQNYILTRIFKIPVTDATLNGSRNVCEENQTIQYIDGLGRPLQTIQVQGSPGFKDIVQPVAYDAFGREQFKYLPYVSGVGGNGSFKTAAIADQTAFYNDPVSNGAPGVTQITGAAFSETEFESSPLSRVKQQGAPGAAWQLSGGHTIKVEYGTNIENEVKLWTVNSTGNGAVATFYLPGKLYKTISKNENWIPSDLKAGTMEEFRDFEGRVVLKRVWETDAKGLYTYYVYDDFGNLRYVLPPAVNNNGQSPIDSFDETLPVFDGFIYGYRYDGLKRLVEKKIPGKGWEFMVYSALDQLVFSQDAVQRANSQWIFNKYDALGRIVITGLYTDGSSRTALQISVDNQLNTNQPLWETRYNADASGIGYTNTTIPTSIMAYHTVNYYDDYDFSGNSFGQPSGSQAPNERTRGLLTGSNVQNLGTGTMLLSVNYYDLESRVVQRKSTNHLNGTDVVDNTYNFAGELTASTRTHVANGATTVIANRYEYDHVGRKIATFENINNQGEVALNHLEYNEIGQLNKKNLHNDTQATTFAYNERGWMKNSSSDQFSMELKYNDGILPQFNGNISGQDYTNGASNAFSYTYDRLNRLTNATAGNSLGEAIGYDVMGNISSLTREGFSTNNYIGYDGNKLTAISGFTNSSYTYDANGNLKTDSEKNITLGYNFLNLPQTVSGSQNLNYTYNAAGEKLKKQNGSTTTDYVDGIQYTNGNIDFIHTEEGIARNSSGTYSYEYNLSDHLGNVRATFYNNPNTGQLEVLQRDDYYAFGLRKTALAGANNNKYLYNGKELQEELGQYDYGARFYDPVIGRWNVIDPMAEQDRKSTPYNYAFNNPILFIDPDGMFGDYYGTDGKWLGTDHIEDDRAYVAKDGSYTKQGDGYAIKKSGITELEVGNNELMQLASTSYGESGDSNVKKEVYGIASAIMNNKEARGDDATISSTIKGFAFAATDGNPRTTQFNNSSNGERNGTFMQTAIGGAINAVQGGVDYSNGATHWAGLDIGSNAEKRATGGLLFTDQSHDMQRLGSKTVNGAPITTHYYNSSGKATGVRGSYSYRWETTAAHGGTTFMKKTNSFIKASGERIY